MTRSPATPAPETAPSHRLREEKGPGERNRRLRSPGGTDPKSAARSPALTYPVFPLFFTGDRSRETETASEALPLPATGIPALRCPCGSRRPMVPRRSQFRCSSHALRKRFGLAKGLFHQPPQFNRGSGRGGFPEKVDDFSNLLLLGRCHASQSTGYGSSRLGPEIRNSWRTKDPIVLAMPEPPSPRPAHALNPCAADETPGHRSLLRHLRN
jgi:hypothetical protein